MLWIVFTSLLTICWALKTSNQCFLQPKTFCTVRQNIKTCTSSANSYLDCSIGNNCKIQGSTTQLPKSQTVQLSCLQNQIIDVQAISYALPKSGVNQECVASGTEICMSRDGVCTSTECCTDCCQDRSKIVTSCRETDYKPVTLCQGKSGVCNVTVQRRRMVSCQPDFEDCQTTQSNQYSRCYSVWVEVAYVCNGKNINIMPVYMAFLIL